MQDYEPRTPKNRVRRMIQNGQRPAKENAWGDAFWKAWGSVESDLRDFSGTDPQEWPAQIAKLRRTRPGSSRQAALSSPRAFAQLCEIRDDRGDVVMLKDFHVRCINHMRQTGLVEILIPFSHGKSWLSSMMVPLMDWAEDPEFTQIRLYKSEDFTIGWTRNLMDVVERNDALHELFPDVSKPQRGDPAHKDWSTDRFSIRGKQNLVSPSFRPLTWAKRTTGVRGDRTGCDDWVNDGNDDSIKIQDEMFDYFNSGVLTMRTIRQTKSSYGTVAGNVFLVGTIFHRQDINSRIQRAWKNKPGRQVIRIDVFPSPGSEDRQEVIWPEKRPYWYIMELKDSLGERGFNMRCRNMPQGDDGTEGFDERKVREAVSETLRFGEPPTAMPLIIGFDPATSKRTKYTKYPAVVVLGLGVEDETHFVEWSRWRGRSFPDQVGSLIDLARRYQCPIAVEDNQTQLSYAEQISVQAPDLRVFTHTTTINKRDPIQGVEQFIPLFRNGKVVIHGADAPKGSVKDLTTEFVDFPQGEFTDLVMAAWIGRRQYQLHNRTAVGQGFHRATPSYVQDRRLGGFLDIRSLKEALR